MTKETSTPGRDILSDTVENSKIQEYRDKVFSSDTFPIETYQRIELPADPDIKEAFGTQGIILGVDKDGNSIVGLVTKLTKPQLNTIGAILERLKQYNRALKEMSRHYSNTTKAVIIEDFSDNYPNTENLIGNPDVAAEIKRNMKNPMLLQTFIGVPSDRSNPLTTFLELYKGFTHIPVFGRAIGHLATSIVKVQTLDSDKISKNDYSEVTEWLSSSDIGITPIKEA